MNAIDKCTRIPIAQATTPFDGARVHAKLWWVVVDECILMYRGRHPQCNANVKIAERIAEKLYPGATVQRIDAVFVEDREQ